MTARWAIPILIGLVAAAAVAVAVTGDDAPAAVTAPAPGYTARCGAESSVPPHPVRRADLTAGPLRIMGLRSLRRAKPSDLYRLPGASAGQVKAPVVLTGNGGVTIVVPAAHRRALSLYYDHAPGGPRTASDGDAVVHFEACEHDGSITGYPGVILYAGPWPQCVPLDFWIEGDDQPVRRVVSFGARRC